MNNKEKYYLVKVAVGTGPGPVLSAEDLDTTTNALDELRKPGIIGGAAMGGMGGLLGGTVLGGGIGGIYGAFRKKKKDESRLSAILSSMGTGGGVGAVTGAVGGGLAGGFGMNSILKQLKDNVNILGKAPKDPVGGDPFIEGNFTKGPTTKTTKFKPNPYVDQAAPAKL